MAARSLAAVLAPRTQGTLPAAQPPDRLGQILKRRDQVGLAAETLQVVATAVFVGAAAFWMWSGSECRQAGPPPVAVVWGRWRAACSCCWPRKSGFPGPSPGSGPIPSSTTPGRPGGRWRRCCAPLVLAARFVDAVLHRLAGRPPDEPDEESFEEEIRTIVTEGHREGLLEEDAREMIEGVIELGDVDVSQIMTPRTDMISHSRRRSPGTRPSQLVIKPGHTRIPVYGKNRDDIVGILYIKDLLPELAKPPQDRVQPWTKLLRQPVFVPETKPVDALLQDFQRGRHHMAVVLDEYGGVSGLVTMEDVLEEIVGEIVDEYDGDEVEPIRQLGDGRVRGAGPRPHRRGQRAARPGPARGRRLRHHRRLRVQRVGPHSRGGRGAWSGTTCASRCWRPRGRRIERVRIEVLDDAARKA